MNNSVKEFGQLSPEQQRDTPVGSLWHCIYVMCTLRNITDAKDHVYIMEKMMKELDFLMNNVKARNENTKKHS